VAIGGRVVDEDSTTVVRDVAVVVGRGPAVLAGAVSESEPEPQPSASATQQHASPYTHLAPRSVVAPLVMGLT
jgi:hypothetical protein